MITSDIVEMDVSDTVNLEVRLTRSSIQKFGESNEENASVSEKKKNVSFIDGTVSEDVTQIFGKVKAPRTKRNKMKSQKKILSGSLTSDEGFGDLAQPQVSSHNIPAQILRPRHQLQHAWTFWFFRNTKDLSWEQNQTKLATVETIEDFWQVHNYIQPASQLGHGCDYSVFRAGIFPDWEDFQNMSGGRWILRNQERTNLDDNWLELLFLLIGEHAGEEAGLVNGAVVNVRSKGDRLALWLKEARDMAGVVRVGRLVKTKLCLGPTSRIQFSVHREERERVKGGSSLGLPDISL